MVTPKRSLIKDVEKIIIAGFGGQGIMFTGRAIAEAATKEDKCISYIRSYGAEMRGGTAHCLVRIKDKEITSPVFKLADAGLIMNHLSWKKFRDRFREGAVVVVNKSLIKEEEYKEGINVSYYPLNDIALSLGDIRLANTVGLGALIKRIPFIKKESIESFLKERFKSNPELCQSNLKALEKGWHLC